MAPQAQQQQYQKDERVLCFHHELLYEAKIMDSRLSDPSDKKSNVQYLVHYKGWKNTWDDWVFEARLRKLTDENKELAQNLKKDLDAQRKPMTTKATTMASKKKAAGSDLSSGRGSEERNSSVPAMGRGQKRGRDYELEKVNEHATPVTLQKPAGGPGRSTRGPERRRFLDGNPNGRAPGQTNGKPPSHSNVAPPKTKKAPSPKSRKPAVPVSPENTTPAILGKHAREHTPGLSDVPDKTPSPLKTAVLAPSKKLYSTRKETSTAPEEEGFAPPEKATPAPSEEGPPPLDGKFTARRSRRNAEKRVLGAWERPEPPKIRKTEKNAARPTLRVNGVKIKHTYEGRKEESFLGPTAGIPQDDWLHYNSMETLLEDTDEESEPKGKKRQTQTEKDSAAAKRDEKFAKVMEMLEDCADSNIQEDDFHARPKVSIPLPDHLKAILVDDWENVTKNLSLVPLPSKTPVNVIMDTYYEEERGKRLAGSAEMDMLEEVVAGMKDYFNRCLGKILLYRFEREQYSEVRNQWIAGTGDFKGKENVEPGDVYGAEHLARLFSAMPELIAQTNMDTQAVNRLKEELTKMVNWLTKNANRYFTAEYETADSEYIEKARGV
ncbi:MAG: Esa1p-associated factor [Icmadophila ericetorum]|nr:Esa1p-associated factor [Icmadophila ericetorum]